LIQKSGKWGIKLNLYVNFLIYLGVALLLLLIGMILFEKSTTKINEFQLIREKNISAALSLGGKLIGLAFVLGSSIEHSISLLDMVIWGAIGIVAQIITFIIAELVTIRFSINQAIKEDNRAVGVILFTLSISVGWVVAKCLTY
jgi:putative membrane protein